VLGASNVPGTAVEGSGDGGAGRSVVLVEGWTDGFNMFPGRIRFMILNMIRFLFFVKTRFGGKGYSARNMVVGFGSSIMAIFTIG
jgi:hypothetical protein